MRHFKDAANPLRQTWYDITSKLDHNMPGKYTRFYQINCRKCTNAQLMHANGMGEDGLYKWFQARGWVVGKTKTRHICPDCVKAAYVPPPSLPVPKPPSEELPPPMLLPINPITAAWEAASYDQHKEFLFLMRDTMVTTWHSVIDGDESRIIEERDRLLAENAQLHEDIKGLLEDPNILAAARIEKKKLVAERMGEVPSEDDDEPADWWKEMATKHASKSV